MNGRSFQSPTSKIGDRVRLGGQTCRSERLPCEPLPQRIVARVSLGKHLDRDSSAEGLVLGSVDLAHAAETDALRVAVAGRKDVVRGRHCAEPIHSRIRGRRNLPLAGAFPELPVKKGCAAGDDALASELALRTGS